MLHRRAPRRAGSPGPQPRRAAYDGVYRVSVPPPDNQEVSLLYSCTHHRLLFLTGLTTFMLLEPIIETFHEALDAPGEIKKVTLATPALHIRALLVSHGPKLVQPTFLCK